MSHTEQMREALDRMDALLDSGTGLLAVPAGSATHTAAVADMRTIRAALTAPAAEVPEAMGDEPALPEPDSYMFQHDETGQTMFVDSQQVEWGFEANNPRLHKIGGAYTADQLRTYAKQYAQWQSTRLRGGVPDQLTKQIMDALRDGLSVCMSVSICRDRKVVRDGVTLYAQTEEWCRWLETEVGPKIRAAVDALTAAPQAPALGALDAGVVSLRCRIKELIAEHGTLRAVARSLSLDVGYLSRLEHGDKTSPSPEVLAKLGLRDVGAMYERLAAMSAQAGKGGAA